LILAPEKEKEADSVTTTLWDSSEFQLWALTCSQIWLGPLVNDGQLKIMIPF
jgi:hypothetical protein